jgi:hypothetical protein
MIPDFTLLGDQCDEGRPSCGQCLKSNRDCQGYRNENDLLFRNETEVTERRVKRTTHGKRASPHSSSSSGSSRSPTPGTPSAFNPLTVILPDHSEDYSPKAVDSWALSIPRSLNQSHEQTALTYFFSHFILVPRHSQVSRGYLEYLLPLYINTSLDSALSAATSAISLATFGNHPDRKYLLDTAQGKYSEALIKVNRALQDPLQAKQDDTLMTILLFSLFEVGSDRPVIRNTSPKLLSWIGKHHALATSESDT